ncbi:MAG: Ig-like domain-containing protein, partial [Butyrivibrio sp.]|nr:Ig-like domain-containing protein [Butyrivibrio sp.]
MKRRLLSVLAAVTLFTGNIGNNSLVSFANEETDNVIYSLAESSVESSSDENASTVENSASESNSGSENNSTTESSGESSTDSSTEDEDGTSSGTITSTEDSDLSLEEASTELPDNFYTEYPTGNIYVEKEYEVQSVSDGMNSDDWMQLTSTLPSKYVNSNLPGLRDQSPYGTCWAFATTGLAEINLMHTGKMTSPDLSELHLAYFTYNTVVDPLGGTENDSIAKGASTGTLDFGGNIEWGLNTFSRWIGVADEDTADYKRDATAAVNSGLSENRAYEDVAHIVSYHLENFDTTTDNITNNKHAGVKQLIYDYGAVGISFYAYNSMSSSTSDAVYNTTTNAYYNPNSHAINHAVIIVGWDDDFSKDNFAQAPPGDGAFLVRNSWMTGTGTDSDYNYAGYFWMSYYEATLGSEAIAAEFDLSSDYDNNYEYDGGINNSVVTVSKAANIYTSHAEGGYYGEYLEAVSFFTSSSNVDYEINVYTNLTDMSDPESGELACTTAGTTTYAGFITVPLSKTVYLPYDTNATGSGGTTFSVVVGLTKDGSATYLGQENTYSSYGTAEASEGQSFYYSGSKWVDVCDTYSKRNYIIKAYTNNAETTETVEATSIDFDIVGEDNELTVGIGESTKVVATVLPAGASNRTVSWSSSNTDIATVSDSGMIVGIAEGTTNITVTSGDGAVSRTINLTVKKKLLGLNVYRYSPTLYVGETYEFWCSLNPSDYETTSSVEWTTDSDRISITKKSDRTANITILKPGDWDLIVTLDGFSKTINFYAFISDDSYGYEAASDNTVELWWDPVEDATGYWLYDKSGFYLASISPDETTEKYTYTDETYKNDYTQSSTVYQLRYNIDGEIYAVNIDVTLNTIATITYEVGDGTQNENNPTTYSPGTEVTLYDPTPPEGYEFDGWYLSSDYSSTSKREKILETDSGNLTLYAKYVKIT